MLNVFFYGLRRTRFQHPVLTGAFRSTRHATTWMRPFCILLLLAPVPSLTAQDVIIAVGHGGETVYEETFADWTQQLTRVLSTQADTLHVIGPSAQTASDSDTDRERLLRTLQQFAEESTSPLVLIFIGHGTATQDVAKFNLVGPDLTASETANALQSIERPVVLINCTASSGPFINRLSGPNRTTVTATRSGSEYNFARFGGEFARALSNHAADLDHDTEVSVLEAFLAASAGVKQFYEQEGRIASEHALLDDNGDQRGTPADFFRGGRLEKASQDAAEPDGQRAARQILLASPNPLPFTDTELAERDRIEAEIDALRKQKESMTEADYYHQLRDAFTRLAKLYAAAEARQEAETHPPQ